ncbi:MAG TPA: DUF4089 domain-containing protein [Burkholderiales bacterium]|jgi:hypothetical protein|nr:DUF4089 domain-containing protein [Burkholderiales bacterium]
MTPDQIEKYVDAAAAALDLNLAPGHRPGVLENFTRLAQLAALVNEFPLAPEDEPAPLWKPGA